MNVSRETGFDFFLERFADSLELDSNTLKKGFSYSRVTFPATGLLVLALYKKYKQSFLVLFDDDISAEKFYSSCLGLSQNSVFYFPESSLSDIDIKGFNLENERYRSEVVNTLRGKSRGVVFTSPTAANEPAIESTTKKEAGFSVGLNNALDRQNLIDALLRWGYESVDRVETPKTFSLRGGIVDIFLPYSAHPLRLEFFGSKIESIRLFNPSSQRTIKHVEKTDILPPPILKPENKDKQSLLNIYNGTIVYVKKSGEFYSIYTDSQKNALDLGCVPVAGAETAQGISLEEALKKTSKNNIYLFSTGNRIPKVLEDNNIENYNNVVADINSCFYLAYANILCLSDLALNGQKPINRSRWSVETVARIPQKEFYSLDDIDWGDHLVHQDFGIGLYRGLEIIKTQDGVAQELIKIEYADQANVYVPVEKFNRVHKMMLTGNKEPELSGLNSTRWNRQKQVAKNTAQDAVQDLINLYSSRSKKRGFNYLKGNGIMAELQESFPYDETPGQSMAINDVINDMEGDCPVDRLICGDVGFGKTEVALRAALKAIVSGKKVLFLTPTTILADQHYISTKVRFDPLGINTELLSRFKTKKEQGEILEKMMTGAIDLVIGTHRLLSQDVNFPELGLLIIDEEHRFGVKHKERLRRLRSAVDVITLTATPIPRTLQQSLLNIRDISRISTPPKTRRPIKTFVQYFDWKNVSKIIRLEVGRGGQVYFLHNDIASIPFILKTLNKLFPNNIIGVAHGKLGARELEQTVLTFFDGKIDILLCTTIIESGLDVANANTIIINNAQNFGLSQLYQIRGRVGRGNRQAYCHLLLPKGKAIGENARKRLKAIEQYTTLGSGYDISLKDLEIRGAGNLFGYKQSGHIAKVGFEMYCKLLQEAVDETLGNPAQKQSPAISMPINALLDNKYIFLVQDRLYFYQQLSDAQDIGAVNEIEKELMDRFGKLPVSAKNLLYITQVRILLSGTSVSSLSVIGSTIKIKLTDFKPYGSVEQLIEAVSRKMDYNDLDFKFAPGKDGFNINAKAKNADHAIKSADLFVELFSE